METEDRGLAVGGKSSITAAEYKAQHDKLEDAVFDVMDQITEARKKLHKLRNQNCFLQARLEGFRAGKRTPVPARLLESADIERQGLQAPEAAEAPGHTEHPKPRGGQLLTLDHLDALYPHPHLAQHPYSSGPGHTAGAARSGPTSKQLASAALALQAEYASVGLPNGASLANVQALNREHAEAAREKALREGQESLPVPSAFQPVNNLGHPPMLPPHPAAAMMAAMSTPQMNPLVGELKTSGLVRQTCWH